MANLPFNEIFLSIFTKDGYYSLCYYSFNKEGLFYKDKFSDNTLNFENVLAFVRQIKPTFCLLNLNSKLELYHLLADALSELFITSRIDDLDSEESSIISSNDNIFTSIKNNNVLNQPDIINNLNQQKNQLNNHLNNQQNHLNNQSHNYPTNSSNNQMANNKNNQSSLQNDLITTTVQNKNSRVLLLTNKYYNLDACKKEIFDCDFNKENIFTENDKRIFISSLINLSDESLIKSIGSLLIYINQNKLGVNINNKGLSIKIFERFECENYVNIDQVTLNELNVFSYKDHPSIFKKDVFRKDDSSLFSLINKCKSSYGTNYLRRLFFQPINCYQKLNYRLNDIQEMMSLSKNVLYAYYACLKKIKPINSIIERMKIMVLNSSQFLNFATTIDNLIILHQHVVEQSNILNLQIYDKIKDNYPIELEQIIIDIKVVINLEKSAEDKKIEINADVNEELDKMKLEFEKIEDILSIAAENEKNSKLIDYIPNFQIIFSPIFGFVIQVYHKELERDNEKKMLFSLKDIKHISTTDKFKYFKTKNLEKYDESYSDLLMEISCKQNAILLDLQNGILNRLSKVFDFLEMVGEFDCLLRFAQVAKLYNWVRPTFNFDNLIDIKNGRHPLKEASENSFIPNDYYSKYPKSIKILTGANNSGKTIYLKQNCLIIYIAYLGSFVPADKCNIPLFSKILTKIETIESISLGLSSFTNDLCRLSNIIAKIPYNSLVVVDEFGKGTNFEDGLSIFAAYINFIIDENPKSHFIFSTHIHSLPSFLENCNLVDYQQMEVKFENEEIFYTYNIVDGFAEFSFPLALGKKIRFDRLILERAKRIRELNEKGASGFQEMAAYTQNELDKVNRILSQISLIKSMADQFKNNDIEMNENEDGQEQKNDVDMS